MADDFRVGIGHVEAGFDLEGSAQKILRRLCRGGDVGSHLIRAGEGVILHHDAPLHGLGAKGSAKSVPLRLCPPHGGGSGRYACRTGGVGHGLRDEIVIRRLVVGVVFVQRIVVIAGRRQKRLRGEGDLLPLGGQGSDIKFLKGCPADDGGQNGRQRRGQGDFVHQAVVAHPLGEVLVQLRMELPIGQPDAGKLLCSLFRGQFMGEIDDLINQQKNVGEIHVVGIFPMPYPFPEPQIPPHLIRGKLGVLGDVGEVVRPGTFLPAHGKESLRIVAESLIKIVLLGPGIDAHPINQRGVGVIPGGAF